MMQNNFDDATRDMSFMFICFAKCLLMSGCSKKCWLDTRYCNSHTVGKVGNTLNNWMNTTEEECN